jgi:ribosomal 30S subunit maturation factor RimM
MAPNLYNIAKFKNKYVHYELSNRNWIKNLQGVSTISQLEELNNLFMAPSSTSLNDQDDEIR